jgi:Raf kinase inhibitor-like YbhB/YbcL family protein
MQHKKLAGFLVLVLLEAAQLGEAMADNPDFEIWSPVFKDNQAIPAHYTGEAEDISPPLLWSGVPLEAKALAVLMDDPDAPQAEPFTHWIAYNLPPSLTGLSEAIRPGPDISLYPGALQGRNSWGEFGYKGPYPPKGHGIHHYHFTLFALTDSLDAKPGLDRRRLLQAVEPLMIKKAVWVGTYSR